MAKACFSRRTFAAYPTQFLSSKVVAPQTNRRMLARFISIVCLLALLSCQPPGRSPSVVGAEGETIPITHATGFQLTNYPDYLAVSVSAPYPGAHDTLRYYLYRTAERPQGIPADGTAIRIPVSRIVLTSTTDVPLLEAIREETSLLGFPNTQYVLSAKTRSRIEKGLVVELGSGQALNPETVLMHRPDLIVGFAAAGNDKAFAQLQRAGLPVVMNGSWLEAHPLGRVEWLKFIAAFYDKLDLAEDVFTGIQSRYEALAEKARTATENPTVIAGSLYKDVWYSPGGSSYMAHCFSDAGLRYPWAETTATGSLSLSLESVLERGAAAALWLLPTYATTRVALAEENAKYRLFAPYQSGNVYVTRQDERGIGIPLYEQGALRADQLLEDLIRIGHPELFDTMTPLTFYRKLN